MEIQTFTIFEDENYGIDLRTLNLQKEFDYYNKLVFNSELPYIDIEFASMKPFGQFLYKQISREPIKIRISNKYKRTYENFRNTFVHEMLHYYICFKRINDNDTHGRIFVKMLEEINNKHGFGLAVASKLNVDVLDDLKKPVYIIVFETPNGKSYAKVKELLFNRYIDEEFLYVGTKIISSQSKFRGMFLKTKVFKTKNPKSILIPDSTKMTNMTFLSFFNANEDSDFQQFERDECIFEITSDNGQVEILLNKL